MTDKNNYFDDTLSRMMVGRKIELVRFAHNWNDGTMELRNDGFKKNEI